MTEELISDLKGSEFVPRDLSWLAFNQRVLQEAADPSVPLYERMKFLAIFSSNLDEFYRVRVASYRTLRELKKKERVNLDVDVKPNRRLKQIKKAVNALQQDFGNIYRRQIIPALFEKGIQLLDYHDLAEQFPDEALRHYDLTLKDQLIELKLNEDLFLENHRLYLVGQVSGELVFLSWPAGLDRFVVLDTGDERMAVAFVEDIIRLAKSRGDSSQWFAIKMSRDAELFVEEERGATIADKVKASLANRDIGMPARLLYDEQMPKSWLKTLKRALGLSKYDLIPGARHHHFSDFFQFPLPEDANDLLYPDYPPLDHPLLENGNGIWESVQKMDLLLSFPYQKFDYLLLLLEECIADPRTCAIQMTIYRTGEKSPVVDALLEALERGIDVFVFMEVKARFDEEPNLYWGEELVKKGAVVQYSFDDLKVHTKCLLITKTNGSGLSSRLAWIGTGNFNHKTAKIYADHALLTCNQDLTDDLTGLFETLKQGKLATFNFQHLWVAPFNLRENIVRAIENEISRSEKGYESWMVLKMNNLEDSALIRSLYRASKKGVKITLLVRGICCLNPDHPDAGNIRILSLIDRFLEHARIYLFCNGGEEKMYLGSADWMTRNMDRRVEVVAQIYSKKVFHTLRHLLSLQARDNVKSRHQQTLLQNDRVRNDRAKLRTQAAFYHFLRSKSHAAHSFLTNEPVK